MNDDLNFIIGSLPINKIENLIIENEEELSKLQERLIPILIQIESIKLLIKKLEREIYLRQQEDINVFIDNDEDEETTEPFNPFERKAEQSITDENMKLLLQFSNLKNELEKILKNGAN
ncbi:hypothetical protein ACI2U6_16435 [Ralstonia nicotianae]